VRRCLDLATCAEITALVRSELGAKATAPEASAPPGRLAQ
jgi:hypothetical protein